MWVPQKTAPKKLFADWESGFGREVGSNQQSINSNTEKPLYFEKPNALAGFGLKFFSLECVAAKMFKKATGTFDWS